MAYILLIGLIILTLLLYKHNNKSCDKNCDNCPLCYKGDKK